MIALRGFLIALGVVTMAAIQYLLGPPWRYVVLSAELLVVSLATYRLYGRVNMLTEASEEHRARLDAIAEVAEKSKVVTDANHIVDGLLGLYLEQGVEDPVESRE